MFADFNFSKEDISLAKSFFDEADALLQASIADPESGLSKKLDEEGQIGINYISDAMVSEITLDSNGEEVPKKRPVIDLVQQGGGMWGIALLGYCYILEKVGIRFFSHGGTSAGAINALFLSSIPAGIYKLPPYVRKETANSSLKSELLTLMVSKMDFSAFIDSKGIAQWFQLKLFKSVRSGRLQLLIGLSLVLILSLVYFILSVTLVEYGMTTIQDVSYFSFVIGTFNTIALVLLIYILITKKLGERFGLNTGDKFLDWVKGNLEILGIQTTEDLYANLGKTNLIREKNTPDKEGAMIYTVQNAMTEKGNTTKKTPQVRSKHPELVFITANLTHHRIVRFPARAGDYWENHMKVHPAAYVRASMSLPFIFETFVPNNDTHFSNKEPANKVKFEVRMVDGGMLSNFPIRDFHRSDGKSPSFPTFGILLSERPKIASQKHMQGKKNTLARFISSFISTFRNFYDNDYLLNQEEINMLIETVNTLQEGSKNTHINWLDFGMSNDDKKLLFKRGAEAAIKQLVKFDWETYRGIRQKTVTK